MTHCGLVSFLVFDRNIIHLLLTVLNATQWYLVNRAPGSIYIYGSKHESV